MSHAPHALNVAHDINCQVFVAAAAQMGTFPQCPDSVVSMTDLESAPAFVMSAGIFNVIGSTQLPQCSG